MFETEIEHRDLGIDGERVDVYRNLNDDCLSVMSRDTDGEDYGSVIAHPEFVLLSDVEFIVQDSGRERVREEEQKNVHAFVRGEVMAHEQDAEFEWNIIIRSLKNDVCNVNYDPYEMDQFQVTDPVRVDEHDYEESDPIQNALYASVTTAGVGVMLPSDSNEKQESGIAEGLQ